MKLREISRRFPNIMKGILSNISFMSCGDGDEDEDGESQQEAGDFDDHSTYGTECICVHPA